MAWLIDIVLVLIAAIAGYVGYKKGAVKMLLSFLVILLALGISFVAAKPMANAAYDWFFAQSVSQTVDAALADVTEETVNQTVEEFLGSGSAVSGLGGVLGFDNQQVSAQIQDKSLNQIATVLKEDVIAPAMILLLQCLLFVLLFCILWIVLWLIAKGLCHTAKMPVIRGFNALCGGFIGLLIGLVLCGATVYLLDFLIALNPEGILGITQEVKEATELYRWLSQALQM